MDKVILRNTEEFEAWLYSTAKDACAKINIDVVIAYDDSGNAYIGDKKWIERYYPNATILK
jgi:hypothetical protein